MSAQENTITQVLAKQLHAVYLEDDWFKGLLLHVKKVDATHASRTNPGGTSSAAGQVGHVLYWLRFGRRWLAGEEVEGDQDASFTHMQVDDGEWAALKKELEDEVALFQNDIHKVHDWNKKKLNVVFNQIAHAAYHAGSVIQILKATA